MTQRRVVPFDAVDEPEPGMLYSDRLGPWFDLDGAEMIPVATEAVEGAVELLIGAFQLWSNLPKIDGTSVAIDFPLLPSSSSTIGSAFGEDGRLPGKGFLIAYHSSAAAVGRLAEDLLSGCPRAAPGRVSAAGSCGGCPRCRAGDVPRRGVSAVAVRVSVGSPCRHELSGRHLPGRLGE